MSRRASCRNTHCARTGGARCLLQPTDLAVHCGPRELAFRYGAGARPAASGGTSAIGERAELRWVTPDEVANPASHRVLGPAWPALGEQLDSELVLVVDAANVVGSRPDGWWRDRRGAAERLLRKLAALARSGVPGAELGLTGGREWTWWPRIVVVVEGQAKSVSPVDGVEVVAAETDGDSEIVKVVAGIRARRSEDTWSSSPLIDNSGHGSRRRGRPSWDRAFS